ncbi:hypothetical protein [Alistipes finegoldii]|uniref:hypothetical protein n=1 Tax=Alistipes finegoldii TaxID=214856 RepID=UPI001FC8C018|nr:hypothetical protein [Alistipes finegoldii]
MVSADRLPAVNRLAATLPARFPVVNCLAVGSALDFGCRLPLQRLLFVRFLVVNRFAAVSAPDFWLRIAFEATFARPVSGCQLSCAGFRTGFLAVDRLCGDFRRPILAAWFLGSAVSLLPDPCGRCGSGALAAAACGSRFSGRRAPEFRRLPQKMLSH